MKNQLSKVILTFSAAVLILFSSSCNRGKAPAVAEDLPAGMHGVSIIEVIQTSSYTYLQVFENAEKYWIAVAAREAKPGDVIYFTDAMEMRDFHSKELDRTFPVIYFVQDPSDSPEPERANTTMGKPSTGKMSGIEIEHLEDGITISTLYADKGNFNGKTVKIRDMVVKFNDNIMGKNWAHIQDGTGEEGMHDLTITTLDVVEVGNIVTFEGKIELNKDFGSGYVYDVIMQEAKATDVKPTAAPM
jgi:hypothetical protein